MARFTEGVVQNILAFVVGSLVLAGLAYLANILSVVFVGVALAVGFGIIFIIAKVVQHLGPRGIITQAKETALPTQTRMRVLPRTLKHVATVTLDTEVDPFDSYSERFEEGDKIEVDVKSMDSASFHFFVCNHHDFEVNQRRSVNFERYEGKEYTARFKKQIVIPSSDMWHFIAYTPAGEEYTTVQLKISRVLYRGNLL